MVSWTLILKKVINLIGNPVEIPDATYTKDDFDFDFCSSPVLPPPAEIAPEATFRPSRSSTPVDSPENTFRHIDDYIYQHNGFNYNNRQQEEHGSFEAPIARRPLQPFNYQNNRPVVTKVTKKVKPIVNVSSKKVLLNQLNVTYITCPFLVLRFLFQ